MNLWARVWTTMLGIARERGGRLRSSVASCLLLLFFQGDDHVVQAAGAAVEMRKALRARGSYAFDGLPDRAPRCPSDRTAVMRILPRLAPPIEKLLWLPSAADAVIEAEKKTAERRQDRGQQVSAAALQAQALLRKHLVRRRQIGAQLLVWRKALFHAGLLRADPMR